MLPELTALQTTVIWIVMGAEMPGADIRDALQKEEKRRRPRSLASFYQLVGRMESAGFLEGRYVVEEVDGFTCRERHYKVTGKGKKAYDATIAYHERLASRDPRGAKA